MPIYEEKIKDKKTGKMIPKIIDDKKVYYIRTYIEDEFGNSKQITRHNKKWIGKDGKKAALQEENRLTNGNILEKKKETRITLKKGKELYIQSLELDKDTIYSISTKLDHFCEIDKTSQVDTYPNLDIRKYDKEMFLKWKNQMKNKKYKRSKNGNNWYSYSVNHLNKIYSEVCRLFDFFIIEGYCSQNIARQCGKIGTPKEIKLSNRQKEYIVITYKEYEKLLNVSKCNQRDNTLFDFWFTRGARPGEMRAFRVCDFDYKNSRIMVNHTINAKNELKDPKTAKSKDWIDLDKTVNEKINNLINELKKQDNFNDEWYIFGTDKPIGKSTLNRIKNKYFKLAGIDKNMKLHGFRHSCASYLFSIGIPITVISKILRHEDIKTTMETYTHLINEDYYKELDKINNIRYLKQDQKQDQ